MLRARIWNSLAVLIVAMSLHASSAMAQMAAPTVNLIQRVAMVQSVVPQGAGSVTVSGTMFSIDVDQREYWITAKHILTGKKHPPYGSITEKSVTLSVLNPGAEGVQWLPEKFSVIDPGKDIDIVVLASPEPLLSDPATVTAFPDGEAAYTLGGDCEFLGYPSVVGATWRATFKGGTKFWMPFVKHCTVSAGTSEGMKIILALRCFAWMVTISLGQSEVEFTGDQIDHRFEIAH